MDVFSGPFNALEVMCDFFFFVEAGDCVLNFLFEA